MAKVTTKPNKATSGAKTEAVDDNAKVETKTQKDIQKENEELKKQIEELKKNQIKQNKTKKVKFNDDDEITVISNTVGRLSLSTEKNGNGIVYDFENFGDADDIPYEDLRNICRSNKGFAQQLKFYIVNDDAVKALRLKKYYEKSLTNKQMNTILDNNVNNVVEMYKQANDSQKEIIIQLIVDRKSRGEVVDINVLNTLAELSGKRIDTL